MSALRWFPIPRKYFRPDANCVPMADSAAVYHNAEAEGGVTGFRVNHNEKEFARKAVAPDGVGGTRYATAGAQTL